MIEIIQDTSPANTFRLVAKNSETDTAVGFSELKGTDKPVPVFLCTVEEEHRGQHVGTQLLKKTIIYAKENGHSGIFVRFDGNVRAKMMLKRQGFKFFSNQVALLTL